MAPLNKGQIVGITLGSTVGGIIFVVVLFYSLYALRSAIWVAMTVFEQRYEERRENVPRCFSSNESLSSSTLSRLTQSQNRHIVVYEGLAHYIPPPPSPPPSVDGAPAADRSASPDSISPGATLRDDQLSESCYYIVSGQRTQAVDCSTFLYQLKQPPSTQSLDPSPRFPSAMSIRYNPKLFTIENLLRTDKRSQLIEISEQATNSRDITVALGRNAFDSTRPGAIDATRVINPLELEIRLNPVHFAPSQAEPPMHYDLENSPRISITFMSNQKEEHAKNPRSPYQADQDSLAIPDLSPSIGKGSEDIDMIEPVTPLTSSFTLDSNTTSKICRTSLTSSPLSVDEADDAGEGLSCELYGSKSDLHGTAPFSHDLQILQAHCESAMIEDVVQKMSIPVSAPSSTQLASPCAENILPSSAFLDSTQSESHSSPSVDEAVTNQDTLRKGPIDRKSSNETTTFTCVQCHLPFPTRGKVNDHVNRRHNLRFSCSVCSYKCGLRADLKRHLQTVHSDKYRPVQSFRCPNDSCGSTWRRKDHFKRHLGRCEKRCMISACV